MNDEKSEDGGDPVLGAEDPSAVTDDPFPSFWEISLPLIREGGDSNPPSATTDKWSVALVGPVPVDVQPTAG